MKKTKKVIKIRLVILAILKTLLKIKIRETKKMQILIKKVNKTIGRSILTQIPKIRSKSLKVKIMKLYKNQKQVREKILRKQKQIKLKITRTVLEILIQTMTKKILQNKSTINKRMIILRTILMTLLTLKKHHNLALQNQTKPNKLIKLLKILTTLA